MQLPLIFLLSLFLSNTLHAAITSEFRQKRAELQNKIQQINKDNKNLEMFQEYSKDVNALMEIYCKSTSNCSYSLTNNISDKQKYPKVTLTFTPTILENSTNSNSLTDLKYIIPDSKSSQYEPISMFRYIDGIRYEYQGINKNTYKIPKVVDDKNVIIQEASTFVDISPAGDPLTSALTSISIDNEDAPDTFYQIIKEEKVPSKYVKIENDTCSLLEVKEGACTTNKYVSTDDNTTVYNIKSLFNTQLSPEYNSTSFVPDGIYEYDSLSNKFYLLDKLSRTNTFFEFKPSNESYWRIKYTDDITLEQRISDFNNYLLLNGLEIGSTTIDNKILDLLDTKSITRVKQIVLSNYKQLESSVFRNFLKQKFLGLESIKIVHNFVNVSDESQFLIKLITTFQMDFPKINIETSQPLPILANEKFEFEISKSSSLPLIKLNEKSNFNCFYKNNKLACQLLPFRGNNLIRILSYSKCNQNETKCINFNIEFIYSTAEVYLEPIYNTRRDIICGVEEYLEMEDAICGKIFNNGSGKVCGYPISCNEKSDANICGIKEVRTDLTYEVTSFGTSIEEVKRYCKDLVGYPDYKTEEYFDEGNGSTFYRIICLEVKHCAHESFGCTYPTCRHESFGVERYNKCKNEAFGVKAYKECSDPSFGIKSIKMGDNKTFKFQ